MATITEIKRKILELPPASFQELGDELLKNIGMAHCIALAYSLGRETPQRGLLTHIFDKKMGNMCL